MKSKIKFHWYFLNIATTLDSRTENNCRGSFVATTIATLTLSKQVEDKYYSILVLIYTSRFCIILQQWPCWLKLHISVLLHGNIWVNNCTNPVVLFTIPLMQWTTVNFLNLSSLNSVNGPIGKNELTSMPGIETQFFPGSVAVVAFSSLSLPAFTTNSLKKSHSWKAFLSSST